MILKQNLLKSLPDAKFAEQFEDIIRTPEVRIERIVSLGQSTPAGQWYDQEQAEWVMVLQGHAELEFADGQRLKLAVGDSVNIPAHCRHRVASTALEQETIWLAVFYPSSNT